jgi:hypothetical protein
MNIGRKSKDLVVAVQRYASFIYTQVHFFWGH